MREVTPTYQLPSLHHGPQSSHKIVLGFHLPFQLYFQPCTLCNHTTSLLVHTLASLWDFSHAVPSSRIALLPLHLITFSFLETQLKPCSFREAFSGQLSPVYFGICDYTSSHGALCISFLYLLHTCNPPHLANVCSPSPTTTSIRKELCLLSHCSLSCWLVKLRGYYSTILEENAIVFTVLIKKYSEQNAVDTG